MYQQPDLTARQVDVLSHRANRAKHRMGVPFITRRRAQARVASPR
jgi:hypothetical protein